MSFLPISLPRWEVKFKPPKYFSRVTDSASDTVFNLSTYSNLLHPLPTSQILLTPNTPLPLKILHLNIFHPQFLIIRRGKLLFLKRLPAFAPRLHESKTSRTLQILEDVEKKAFWLSRAGFPDGTVWFFEFVDILRGDLDGDEESQLFGPWCFHFWFARVGVVATEEFVFGN